MEVIRSTSPERSKQIVILGRGVVIRPMGDMTSVWVRGELQSLRLNKKDASRDAREWYDSLGPTTPASARR